MKTTLLAASSALAFFASAANASPEAMTAEEARHLISRTGFGASPQEIKALMGKSYSEGVQIVLGTLSNEPSIPMPAWVNAPDYPDEYIWVLGQTETELFFSNRWMEIEELSGWWFSEMVATPSPLTERLTLFWHDHFATSYETVENPQWMGRQNQFFRANAAGNFADLAHGILKDPAMLVYLSNTENYAESPNENLGREFLELFTLGEGRGYTQADVEAAARMLTGHTIAELSAPVYTFNLEDHDQDAKTLFGQTGKFGADDLANMALAHPEFGPYIVEKLWKTFVSDQPDADEVARLTQVWRDNNLEMRPLLKAMFLSEAFWDESNRGRLVKTPVELIAGTLRSLGTSIDNSTVLAWQAHDLGQALFFPPNVGGWPEGVDWINDASATARATTLSYFAFEEESFQVEQAAMMQMDPVEQIITEAGPEDLRVGQVFAMNLHVSSSGGAGMFVLYDVSFRGKTWRSIPIWIESDTDEDFAGYGLLTTDCAPDCFADVTKEEGDWIWFAPYDGVLDEGLAGASTDDIALLQMISGHLPELIKSTASQVSWKPDSYMADGYRVPKVREAVRLARGLAKDSARYIGRPPADAIIATNSTSFLGLQGYAEVSNGSDINSYIEQAEQDRIRPAVPRQTYADGRDWLNDLPGTGLESQKAALALLAVPRQSQGLRDELVATDPEALVRALILSPEFQVH